MVVPEEDTTRKRAAVWWQGWSRACPTKDGVQFPSQPLIVWGFLASDSRSWLWVAREKRAGLIWVGILTVASGSGSALTRRNTGKESCGMNLWNYPLNLHFWRFWSTGRNRGEVPEGDVERCRIWELTAFCRWTFLENIQNVPWPFQGPSLPHFTPLHQITLSPQLLAGPISLH